MTLFLLGNILFSKAQTEVKKTFYKNGETQFSYTYQNNVLNGPYEGFYENGTKWSEGHYLNGQLEGIFIVYTPNKDTAYIEYYSTGQVWMKIVYYQEYPDYSYKLISKNGFVCVKNGESVALDKNTPDGFIEQSFDSQTFIERNYIWKKGKREEIELPKPNGTIEKVLVGEKPGVYELKNKKKVFIRPLSEDDKKESNNPELIRLLNLMKEQNNNVDSLQK